MTYSAFSFEVTGEVTAPLELRIPCMHAAHRDGADPSRCKELISGLVPLMRDKLGVVGHVENTSSGTVTGEVQGESKPVAQMKVCCSSFIH